MQFPGRRCAGVAVEWEERLAHLGEKGAARSVEKAMETVLREGKVLPGDLGGRATTKEIADAIIARLK